MLIDSEKLKERIRNQEIHKDDDIIERCFNKGLWTAVKVIEIYEETEKLIQKEMTK